MPPRLLWLTRRLEAQMQQRRPRHGLQAVLDAQDPVRVQAASSWAQKEGARRSATAFVDLGLGVDRLDRTPRLDRSARLPADRLNISYHARWAHGRSRKGAGSALAVARAPLRAALLRHARPAATRRPTRRHPVLACRTDGRLDAVRRRRPPRCASANRRAASPRRLPRPSSRRPPHGARRARLVPEVRRRTHAPLTRATPP